MASDPEKVKTLFGPNETIKPEACGYGKPVEKQRCPLCNKGQLKRFGNTDHVLPCNTCGYQSIAKG